MNTTNQVTHKNIDMQPVSAVDEASSFDIFWKKNRYAQHAKVEVTDELEIVTFPASVSDDSHLNDASRFLTAQGINKKPGQDAQYRADLNQVLDDVRVIDLVSTNGADMSVQTDVEHWAYFKKIATSIKYAKILISKGYEIRDCYRNKDKEIVVKFAHTGSLELSDISPRTIWLNRQAWNLKGSYDGWEVTTDRTGNLKAVKH